MTQARLGPGAEFDRIRQIFAALGAVAPSAADDCAILPDGEGRVVVSTDLSVEGVHFRHDWLGFEEIGWRAASGALSDLAAAAAKPIGLTVSVGMPGGAEERALLELMRGVGAAVAAVGGVVLGGDLSRSPQWVVDVTVLGRAAVPITRRGARPGDGIWVTGWLGLARAALVAWQRGEAPSAAARWAFAHPEPRVVIGQALAAAGARAMVDLSDGLGGDAGHLAAASGVRVVLELDRLLIAPEVAATAAAVGEPAARFAALGGEDYELLVAMPASFDDPAAAALTASTGVSLKRIGTAETGHGTHLTLSGHPITLSGYSHFA